MATWSKSDRFASRRPATSDEPGPGSYDAKDVAKSTAGAVIRAARAEVRQRRGKSGKSCRRVLVTMCAVCVCASPCHRQAVSLCWSGSHSPCLAGWCFLCCASVPSRRRSWNSRPSASAGSPLKQRRARSKPPSPSSASDDESKKPVYEIRLAIDELRSLKGRDNPFNAFSSPRLPAIGRGRAHEGASKPRGLQQRGRGKRGARPPHSKSSSNLPRRGRHKGAHRSDRVFTRRQQQARTTKKPSSAPGAVSAAETTPLGDTASGDVASSPSAKERASVGSAADTSVIDAIERRMRHARSHGSLRVASSQADAGAGGGMMSRASVQERDAQAAADTKVSRTDANHEATGSTRKVVTPPKGPSLFSQFAAGRELVRANRPVCKRASCG